MKGALDQALTSTLYRILEFEPVISLQDARERMLQVIRATGMATLDETSLQAIVDAAAIRYKRVGVLNPRWLAARNFTPHFFLVNSQPGGLQQLTEESSKLNPGTSQYIIYGEWDSLIVLYGTDSEAQDQLSALSSPYYPPTYFSAREVPMLYRYRAVDYVMPPSQVPDDIINAVAQDYDNEAHRTTRDGLEGAHILLGPTWKSDDNLSERIIAWVGIKIASHQVLHGQEVLDKLLQDEWLRMTIVHFFVTTQHPFQYFAKLICSSMEELDRATDAIGYARIGPVRMEGVTLVVSRGNDTLPVIRRSAIRRLATPFLDDVEIAARDSVTKMGEDAVDAFNRLNVDVKLQTLSAIRELTAEIENRDWDDERHARLEKAVEMFVRSIIAGSADAGMTGAVLEAAASVEGQAKRLVRVVAENVYGRDYSRIQKELKLASKDLTQLTLGKAIGALEVAKKHDDFSFLHEDLDEQWMERAANFADQRNKWAHDAVAPLWPMYKLEHAKVDLIESVELTRWLSRITAKLKAGTPPVIDTKAIVRLPQSRDDRGPGVFVSHSSNDKFIAERVATALKAVGYNVWYADWAIEPGESIVGKIESGLAHNDTLLVLLSPNSIKSKWVEKELNSAIMAQLNGQNVRVIPLLVGDCAIPATLSEVRYIDMRNDFQPAFIELMNTLEKRWKT